MTLTEDRLVLGFGLLVLAILAGISLYLAVQALRGHLRRRTAELELIARFGQALMAEFQLEDLFALLHHHIERLLTVDVFVIDLYRPATNMAEIVYARYRDQDIHWNLSQTPKGIGTYLARNRHPLLLRGDVNAKIRQLGIEPLQPPIPVCYLGIPLIVANRVVGVLSIESTTDIDAYGPSEVKLMETLVPQIAIALYNADLYARLSAITGELTRINDLAHTVNATLNLDEALNRVCRDLIDLMNADRSAVFLCNEE